MGHSTKCICVVIALSVCFLICESDDQENYHSDERTVSTVALVEKSDDGKGKEMEIAKATSNIAASDRPSSVGSEDTLVERNVQLSQLLSKSIAKFPIMNAMHSFRTKVASRLSANPETQLKSLRQRTKTLQQNRQIDMHVHLEANLSKLKHTTERTDSTASIQHINKTEADKSYFTRTKAVNRSNLLTKSEIQNISEMPETRNHRLSNLNQNNASVKIFIDNIRNLKRNKTASKEIQSRFDFPHSSRISEPKLSKSKQNIARINKPKRIAKRSTTDNGMDSRIKRLAANKNQKPQDAPSLGKDKKKPTSEHVTTKPSGVNSKEPTPSRTAHRGISASDTVPQIAHKHFTTSTQPSSLSDLDGTSISGSEVEELEDREADRRCNQSGSCFSTTSLTSDAYWAAGSLLTVLLLLTLVVLYTGLLKKRNTFDNFKFYSTQNGSIEMDDMKPSTNIKDLLKKIPHLSRKSQDLKQSRRQRSKNFQGNKYRRLPNLTDHESDDYLVEEMADDDLDQYV